MWAWTITLNIPEWCYATFRQTNQHESTPLVHMVHLVLFGALLLPLSRLDLEATFQEEFSSIWVSLRSMSCLSLKPGSQATSKVLECRNEDRLVTACPFPTNWWLYFQKKIISDRFGVALGPSWTNWSLTSKVKPRPAARLTHLEFCSAKQLVSADHSSFPRCLLCWRPQ